MDERRIERRVSRRDVLKWGMGAAGLAFMDWSRVGALAAPERALGAAERAAVRPRAKSVIQIWMWGGPSHLDTFDPKPELGRDYCGPLVNPIPTNVDGVRIGEMLPLLAQQADKYSIIRSMTHGVNGHETAAYMVQTGRNPEDTLVYPSAGAVVSMFKGYDHGYKGLIAPYVVLTTSLGRFSEVGFLDPRYKPFVTGGDPNQKVFNVEGVLSPGITEERQRSRRELLHELDTLGKALPEHPQFQKLDACEEKAYGMVLGDAGKLFDLSQEKDELRDAYGRSKFGQSCLMARRLVEYGVPYITINYGGWDTHKQHFEAMRRQLPDMDRGMSMLLKDLAGRGLLDSTVVWWSGEFGRTPKVQWGEPWNGGRSHFGNCFSAVLAGGGFRGGHVVGASDATGENVATRPVYPQDVIGSIYERLGIDPDGPLPNPRGLNVQVMPCADNSPGHGRLKEIM